MDFSLLGIFQKVFRDFLVHFSEANSQIINLKFLCGAKVILKMASLKNAFVLQKSESNRIYDST